MAELDASRKRLLAALARRRTVIRSRDLEAEGIHRVAIAELVASGALERVGRGIYMLPGADIGARHSLVVAQLRAPDGIVCLLSALEFYRITTQSPNEIWLALEPKARVPARGWPPLRIIRMGAAAREYGVEQHTVEGITVRVTSLAKTVADCFKYRNTIGLDVALEALREYRRKRGSIDALMRAAAVDRVATVLRPYLEMVVT